MIFLIGGNGFVGSGLARLFDAKNLEYRIITRTNFESFRGANCDVLINANGNSKKFIAEKEPLLDFDESVRSVAASIEAFRFCTYVMLSSGDVYPKQQSPEITKEDATIEPEQQSRYGLHKSLAEKLVQGCGRPWIILRMGGFVGTGLKKNAIYDMLTDAPVWLSPESELQFISLDRAASIIWKLVSDQKTHHIFNLGAKGVVKLVDFHRQIGSRSVFKTDAPRVRYELSLAKLENALNIPLPLTIDEVQNFARAVKNGEIRIG